MMSRALFLCLLLASAVMAGEKESAPPVPESVGPGEIPSVDVESNVRKMLEESRARQQAPDSPAAKPATDRRGDERVALPKRTPPPDMEPEDYVPLPEQTITVRSVGDVKAVARELDDARKRKATTSSPSP